MNEQREPDRRQSAGVQAQGEVETREETRTPSEKDSTGVIYIIPNQKAKALYDACPTVKPTWEQLGDVTKGVWLEQVRGKADAGEKLRPCTQRSEPDAASTPPAKRRK